MNAITLTVEIHEDRRLVIDLPQDTPTGTVEVTIRQPEAVDQPVETLTRETARARLLAAGRLVTDIHAPADTHLMSDDELRALISYSPDTPTLEQLVQEDRGII